VGPRFAWALEVDIGTTITERQLGVWLKPSCDTTITGLRPDCSEPERAANSAQ
jgi:hypothetical protein